MNTERSRILELLSRGKITAAEAENLLDALGQSGQPEKPVEVAVATIERPRPKFLRVQVTSHQNDLVNVRLPLQLLRAGIKLGGVLPKNVSAQVSSAMAEKGIDFSLDKAKPEDIEALIDALATMSIDVDSKNGDRVRIFCE